MKKLIFLPIVLFGLVKVLPAQTIYWFENFNGGQGEWTLEENWTIGSDRLEFNWLPAASNFDLSAISPVISIPANIAEMTVNQHLDVFSGTGSEFAEISVHNASESIVLWNYDLVSGNWGYPTGSDLVFPMEQFAGQDIQIEFRTYGVDTYNWNMWDVFEVRLSALFDNDLALNSVSGPVSINVFEEGTWTVNVKNNGFEPQSGFSVKLFNLKSGEIIGDMNVAETINPQEVQSFEFQWGSNAAYNTVFVAVVELEGDVFESNNISRSKFVRVNPDIDFDILVWDNDNGIETVASPEQGDLIQPSTALTRSLDEAGYTYTCANYLPQDLNDYEIVFSTMGCYCVS
jgi:hypothetical protein